jgi:pimeloyl-ACP methyl ester carboxylesterase
MNSLKRTLTANILIMMLAFFTFSASPAKADDDAPTNYQTKVDVGGFSLFIDVEGHPKAGNPTIVFDSGAGDTHSVWQQTYVQQTLASVTRTVSYDRAGLGQSDQSGRPKTGEEQAQQLHTLLHNAGIQPPYLLVSHSIAGLNARIFAAMYPDEVSGIVFVDSSHEDQEQYFGTPLTMEDVESSGEMTYQEYEQTVQQVRDVRPLDVLRNKPITVLSATCHGPASSCAQGISFINENDWMTMQNDIATLSDNSDHTVAQGSGHYIMLERPQLVIDKVNEILERIRELH